MLLKRQNGENVSDFGVGDSESGVCELYSVDNRTNDGILSIDSDKEDR